MAYAWSQLSWQLGLCYIHGPRSVLQYSMPLFAPIGRKFEIKGKGRVVGAGLGPILGAGPASVGVLNSTYVFSYLSSSRMAVISSSKYHSLMEYLFTSCYTLKANQVD